MTRHTYKLLLSQTLLTPKLIVESRDLRAEQNFPGSRHLSVPALKEKAKLPTSGVGRRPTPHPTGASGPGAVSASRPPPTALVREGPNLGEVDGLPKGATTTCT